MRWLGLWLPWLWTTTLPTKPGVYLFRPKGGCVEAMQVTGGIHFAPPQYWMLGWSVPYEDDHVLAALRIRGGAVRFSPRLPGS